MQKIFKQNITTPIIRKWKRWDRKITLTKRQQLVLVTLILTGILLFTQTISIDFRYAMVVVLSVITYLLSAFGLREDLEGVEWITLLILPTLFSAGVGIFYFLLPVRWLTRIPIVVLYAIGIYALLLTENIYNIAANRTIALLRAAHSIGFVLTLVTFFLLVETVFLNRLPVIFNVASVFAISFVLFVQLVWSVTLEKRLEKSPILLSLALSYILTQISWILSFWPVSTTLQVLFLTTCFYATSGMVQQYLQEKLYRRSITEFGIVLGIVLVLVLIESSWRPL
jgi:hypothetical protein